MKNDLHIRTNFSASAEKDWNWEKVLKKCQAAGLERISITDFDTCIFHVISKIVDTSPFFKGQIIPGMECDVCENGLTFELLAYNFDPIKTLNWSYKTYGTLEMRQTKIKDLLIETATKKGYKVDTKKPFNGKVDFGHKYVYENMLKYKKNQLLFKKFGIENYGDFYNISTKQKNFPLFVSTGKVFPKVKKVVDFIHSVGGFVVLAQPYKRKNSLNIDFLLNSIKKFNIDGIEVYHPAHSKENIKFLLQYCKQNKLIVTGGSNFNGKPGTSIVGIENIDKDEKEILRSVRLD